MGTGAARGPWAKPERLPEAVVFVLFALLPGLTYQWVEDQGRLVAGGGPLGADLLGVAPNALGGLSLTVGLGVIARDLTPERSRPALVGAFSLLGLWAWEVLQVWMPGGTFDPHDLAWTVPGVGLGVLVLRCLPPKHA